jgi:CubicO group peptidase (beta-lactamase class C family)
LKPVLAVAALAAGWACAVQAQSLSDDVATTRLETGALGLTAIVMVDREVRAAAADAVRTAGGDTPVTETDRWHLGSITKPMTATLVARLAEKGVVSWDDTVAGVLRDAVPDMRAAYRGATFRHLLSHRAGLQASIPPEHFVRFEQLPPDPIADRLAWARIALSQESSGPLAMGSQCSNSGYVAAAAMLEARTGKPWEELIRAEVFAPLGLESAGFGPPGTAGADDAPRGHRRVASAPRAVAPEVDNPAALSPAARAQMTLEDLARFVDVHRCRDRAYLNAQSFETVHTPPFGGVYAMGWVQEPDGMLGHNGSNSLWYAEVAFAPETGAVAANDGDMAAVGAPASRLLRRLMQIGGG